MVDKIKVKIVETHPIIIDTIVNTVGDKLDSDYNGLDFSLQGLYILFIYLSSQFLRNVSVK